MFRYTDPVDADGEFTKAVLNRIAKHSKPELAARLIIPPNTVRFAWGHDSVSELFSTYVFKIQSPLPESMCSLPALSGLPICPRKPAATFLIAHCV